MLSPHRLVMKSTARCAALAAKARTREPAKLTAKRARARRPARSGMRAVSMNIKNRQSRSNRGAAASRFCAGYGSIAAPRCARSSPDEGGIDRQPGTRPAAVSHSPSLDPRWSRSGLLRSAPALPRSLRRGVENPRHACVAFALCEGRLSRAASLPANRATSDLSSARFYPLARGCSIERDRRLRRPSAKGGYPGRTIPMIPSG